MKLYVGTLPADLCNQLIAECAQHDVEPYYGNRDLDPDQDYYDDHLEQKRLAVSAGYTQGDSIQFRHYYPEIHYSTTFITEFEKIVEAKCLSSFVSEIRPGKCAPWHWDINPRIGTQPGSSIVRYLCFIDTPKYGQAFMLEEECFYLEKQGSIYQYPSLKSWHAGFNAGLKTKYLFTFTGVMTN